MGKFFFYILLILLAATVLSFVLGHYKAGFAIGAILVSGASGIGYVYSSRDDTHIDPIIL